MQAVTISTPQNVAIRTELASLGDRILAYLIDALVLIAFWAVMLGVVAYLNPPSVFIILAMLASFLYHVLLEALNNGQSVGKMVRKIQVVRLDGSPARLGDYLLRWLFRIPDFWFFGGAVAVLCVLVGGKGQRLGDMVAGTTVVRLQPRMELADTLFEDLEVDYVPVFPQADDLTDSEALVIRDTLTALEEEERFEIAEMLGTRASEALQRRLGVTTHLRPEAFLQTLLRDYNYYRGRLEH